MKIIAIGGRPGTGKTSLMRAVLQELDKRGMGFDIQQGLVVGKTYDRVTVLGNYRDPEEVFAGTDRLSMAAQPAVIDFIAQAQRNEAEDTFIFEGDRLFTASMFYALTNSGYGVKIIVLTVTPGEQKRRFQQRGSAQNETFLKGRETKIDNITTQFKNVTKLPNETVEDLENNVQYVLERIYEPFNKIKT